MKYLVFFSKIDPVAGALPECEITLDGTGNLEQVGYSTCTKDPNTCSGLTSGDTGRVWQTTGKTCADKIEGNNTVSCINEGDCSDEGNLGINVLLKEQFHYLKEEGYNKIVIVNVD